MNYLSIVNDTLYNTALAGFGYWVAPKVRLDPLNTFSFIILHTFTSPIVTLGLHSFGHDMSDKAQHKREMHIKDMFSDLSEEYPKDLPKTILKKTIVYYAPTLASLAISSLAYARLSHYVNQALHAAATFLPARISLFCYHRSLPQTSFIVYIIATTALCLHKTLR